MTTSKSSNLFRPINQSLGQQPSLGPIPANLLAPSGVVLVGCYVLVRIIFGLGFVPFLFFSIWGIATWWVVVGEKTWKFTQKFVSPPHWKRGHLPYQPLLSKTHE